MKCVASLLIPLAVAFLSGCAETATKRSDPPREVQVEPLPPLEPLELVKVPPVADAPGAPSPQLAPAPPVPVLPDEWKRRLLRAELRVEADQCRIRVQQTQALIEYVERCEFDFLKQWRPEYEDWAGRAMDILALFRQVQERHRDALRQQEQEWKRAEAALAQAEAER